MRTYFNDPRPIRTWVTTCSGCRAECIVTVKHYPHGPATVRRCPVCGETATDAVSIEAQP